MAIIYDPGTDKALEQISGAVANIAQPYKAQEQALRGLMTKDPDLAQKLADLAYKNPGSIAEFAGPNAERYFHSLNPSAAAQTDVAARPAVKEALKQPDNLGYIASKETTGATPGEVQQSKLKGELAKQGVNVIETMPEAALSGGLRQVTGLTSGKEAADEQLKRRKDDVTAALDVPDMRNEWLKAVTGQPSKLTFRQVSALADDPVQKSLLVAYQEQMKNQRAAMAQKAEDLRASMRQGENLNKEFLNRALDLIVKTGGGTTAAYLKLIGAPQEMIDAAGGYTEAELNDAQSRLDVIRGQSESKTAQGAANANTKIIGTLANADPDTKRQSVQQMNFNAGIAQLPYTYVMDSDGNIHTFSLIDGSELTGNSTVFFKPRGQRSPQVPPNPTSPMSTGKGGQSVSETTRNKTKGSATTPAAPAAPAAAAASAFDKTFSADVRNFHDNAAPKMTADELHKSKIFMALTPSEQAYILSNSKKKSK